METKTVYTHVCLYFIIIFVTHPRTGIYTLNVLLYIGTTCCSFYIFRRVPKVVTEIVLGVCVCVCQLLSAVVIQEFSGAAVGK